VVKVRGIFILTETKL